MIRHTMNQLTKTKAMEETKGMHNNHNVDDASNWLDIFRVNTLSVDRWLNQPHLYTSQNNFVSR